MIRTHTREQSTSALSAPGASASILPVLVQRECACGSVEQRGEYEGFRFTHVEHRPANAPATREVLIERLGAIGMEGLSPSQSLAAQQRFDRHDFIRGSGWRDAEFENVRAAIAEIPDALLTPVDGLRFNRDSVSATDPRAGGDYDPDTHTVTIYDRVLAGSMLRSGVPGAGFVDETVRAVRHEIGHALDLLPLRQAWSRLEQARGARRTAFRRWNGRSTFPKRSRSTLASRTP